MARWDTTQLANTVIRDAKIPAGSSYRDSNNAKILAIATEEQEATLVPALVRVQGNHLLAYTDATLVAGTSRYRLPERAIRPERVAVVNSAGKLVARLPLASGDMVDEVLAGFMPRGDAIGYWAPENNHAVVALRDSLLVSGYSLRTFYRRWPNRLVPTAEAGRVLAVTYAGGTLQCTTSAAPITLTGATTFELVRGSPAFETFLDDVAGTWPGAALFEATLSTDPGVEVGDYVCLPGETAIPQLPVALHAVLAAFTTARVYREMGNTRAADLALAAAQAKLDSSLTTITPRGDDAETSVDEVWLERSEVW